MGRVGGRGRGRGREALDNMSRGDYGNCSPPKLLRPRFQLSYNFKSKTALLKASLFDSRINFPQHYWLSRPQFQTSYNFNHLPKKDPTNTTTFLFKSRF
jgi:hypothetical protein